MGKAVRLDAACVCVNLLDLPNEPRLRRQCIRNVSALRAACDGAAMPLISVAASRQDLTVKLAFLEFQSPTLGDTIAALVDGKHMTIHIAPLFMAQGGHLKHDVPQLLEDIRHHHPALKLDLLPAIGDIADLRDAIAAWLVSTVPGTSA